MTTKTNAQKKPKKKSYFFYNFVKIRRIKRGLLKKQICKTLKNYLENIPTKKLFQK